MSLVTVPEVSAKFNSAQFPSPIGQFEFAREIDLVVVVPNCSMGLFLLHDAATLALTVFLLFSVSAGLPSKRWFLKQLLAGYSSAGFTLD